MTPGIASMIRTMVAAGGMIAAFIYFLRTDEKGLGVLALMIAIIVARVLMIDLAGDARPEGGRETSAVNDPENQEEKK